MVRRDAALLEDDLRLFLAELGGGAAEGVGGLYADALRRALSLPAADALGSKVGQQALPPTPGSPGGQAPLRPSMVYWAYRNYRGFPDASGAEAHLADLSVIRRVAVAVRVLLKAAVVLDDIQDGSDIRYGEPALHTSHGVPVALNTGSWLITEALRHAAQPDAVGSLLHSVGSGFTGQAADLAARTDVTRAGLLAASRDERVRFWESVAALKTGTLFRMPLDAAIAGLGVVEAERHTLDHAMRQLGLASQLFNDLTDLVPEFGGANLHEDFDGLGNRVFLELLGEESEDAAPVGKELKDLVLAHPGFRATLVSLAAEAVELKRAAKDAVHSVCRSEESAAYLDLTVERKGHFIDRLHEALRTGSSS